VNPDGTVNSAAFKLRGQPDPSISVDLARRTTTAATLARASRSGFGLGTLTAGEPRSLGLGVRHDPLPENLAHTLIEGQRPGDKQTARRLARMTRLIIRPEG
jgi:hypothetical protein